jgi:hypothetical protein
MLAALKPTLLQQLATQRNIGLRRKPWQFPRNGIVAIGTECDPVALTIGSKKTERAGRQTARVRGQKYGSNVDERKSINAKRKRPPV